MRAIRISNGVDGKFQIAPLALPVRKREVDESVEHYRRQARGDELVSDFGPQRSNVMRTIVLSDRVFAGLATQPTCLLNFVISGQITVPSGQANAAKLKAGDIFLVDAASGPDLLIEACNGGRILQIDVDATWPGVDAEYQEPGTTIPRSGREAPNFKRMYTADDGRAYFADFSEIFPQGQDQWSEPRPVQGFRMSCFPPGGKLDFHPGVVNQIGLVMSGALELEVSGDRSREMFYPGDLCLSQDRTGLGHRNIKHGTSHSAQIVIADGDLWPFDGATASAPTT